MIAAGSGQFTRDGMLRVRNWMVVTLPDVQTMRVVMSPKGDHAPPALAAMMISMNAGIMNRLLPPLTAPATVVMRSALVRLSARREAESDADGDPEKETTAIPPSEKPCAEGIEDQPLLQKKSSPISSMICLSCYPA
jgi:hypothetical protein